MAAWLIARDDASRSLKALALEVARAFLFDDGA